MQSGECPTLSLKSLLKLAVNPTTGNTPGRILSKQTRALHKYLKAKGERSVLDLYQPSSQQLPSSGPRLGVSFTPGSMKSPVPSGGWASALSTQCGLGQVPWAVFQAGLQPAGGAAGIKDHEVMAFSIQAALGTKA